jgi:hypothetical protein
MATVAQIQLALQRAQAAGDTQAVAALQAGLQGAQQSAGTTAYEVTAPNGIKYRVTAPDWATHEQVLAYAQTQHAQQRGPSNNYAKPAPTREQVSLAFYRAKAAGDEPAARALVGYLQQHGMTLAPMTPEQVNAGTEQVNAANVAAMNPIQRAWVGIGEGANNINAGLRQHVVDPIRDLMDGGNRTASDAALVAQDRQASQPLNATAAGSLGNTAGTIGASAALMLIPGGGETLAARTGLAALEGGGFGYIAPSASEGEHAANTALGAATGPLVAGGGKLAQLLGRGGKSILQRYIAPEAVASSRIGKILAGEGVTPGQLRAYSDPVPGVQPTLAQVLKTPKAVQLERAARNNPVSGPEIAARDLQNNTARMDALQRHVLPESKLAAARAIRSRNFAPTAQALQDAGSIDVGPLRFEAANLAQRGSNATTRAAAKKVLAFVDDNTAKAGENEGTIPIADLHTLQHDLGAIVKQANPEAINTSQALHELQPFKRAIVETVDSLAPGYRAALQQYAKDSAPINTSRTIGDLLNPTKATATDLTGEPTITAARIKSVLGKDDRAPFKMTSQARKDAESVQASLQSRNAAQRSIGPMGSPTEENRLNRFVRGGAQHIGSGIGSGIGGILGYGTGGMAGVPVGGFLGALAGHGADMADSYARNRIAGSVGRILMDPSAAADSLAAYLDLQARRRAFDNTLAPTYLGRNWLGYGSGLVPNVISANRPAPVVTP